MPTYDYQCRSCGSVTEVIHSMLEDGPSVCEACGGELRRVLYPTGIIFKGSGFYRTDSRAGDSASPAAGGTAAAQKEGTADGGPKKTGGGGDAKPAAGSETASSSTTT